jgi:hypothetical protein
LKKGVFALMNQPQPSEATNALVITALLAVVTSVALVLQDLGFVAAITGSLMGSTIIYTFPALFKVPARLSQAHAGSEAPFAGAFFILDMRDFQRSTQFAWAWPSLASPFHVCSRFCVPLCAPAAQLKSLQQLKRPLTGCEKASTYGLMGVGGVLGVVGVAISVLKQFTTLLG